MLLYLTKTATAEATLAHQNANKSPGRRGFASDPAGTGRAYDAPPDPIVGWERGNPLPISHTLDMATGVIFRIY